jgi:hypothetical protein
MRRTVCGKRYQNPVSKGGGVLSLPVVGFVRTNRRTRSAWPPVDFVGGLRPMRGSPRGPRPVGDLLDDGALHAQWSEGIRCPRDANAREADMRDADPRDVDARGGRAHSKGGFSGRRSRRA